MGICLLHKEWSREKSCIMYIVDFTFPVGPRDKGINLDAPAYLITELIKYASLSMKGLFGDSFESASQKQFLDRLKINVKEQSVDIDLNPYQQFLTCLNNETFKAGKNIFLKNNLNSLVRLRGPNGKEKIDHIKGKTENRYKGDWEKSTCGIFAKDVSDACCQALWAAYSDNDTFPTTIYEDENIKYSTKKENIEKSIEDTFKMLHNIK